MPLSNLGGSGMQGAGAEGTEWLQVLKLGHRPSSGTACLSLNPSLLPRPVDGEMARDVQEKPRERARQRGPDGFAACSSLEKSCLTESSLQATGTAPSSRPPLWQPVSPQDGHASLLAFSTAPRMGHKEPLRLARGPASFLWPKP